MKTLSDIQREEDAIRERAAEYERLTNDAVRLRTTIERLSAKTLPTTALERMAAVVDDIPPTVVTKGTAYLAGGFILRDIMRTLVSNGLADARRQNDERQAALTKAKTDLARVETALFEATREVR